MVNAEKIRTFVLKHIFIRTVPLLLLQFSQCAKFEQHRENYNPYIGLNVILIGKAQAFWTRSLILLRIFWLFSFSWYFTSISDIFIYFFLLLSHFSTFLYFLVLFSKNLLIFPSYNAAIGLRKIDIFQWNHEFLKLLYLSWLLVWISRSYTVEQNQSFYKII